MHLVCTLLIFCLGRGKGGGGSSRRDGGGGIGFLLKSQEEGGGGPGRGGQGTRRVSASIWGG